MKALRDYLAEMFRYHGQANLQLLEQIADSREAIRQFDSLIYSHQLWLGRVTLHPQWQHPTAPTPITSRADIEAKWLNTIQIWMMYLERKRDHELNEFVHYANGDGLAHRARIRDIIAQLHIDSSLLQARLESWIPKDTAPAHSHDYIGMVSKAVG